MSPVGQWDTVNGDILRWPTIQTSVHHDRQLERYSISDIKPMLLVEQSTEPTGNRAGIQCYTAVTQYPAKWRHQLCQR